ncbi:MAG: GDSL-type esterase/lipase family protein [Oscillospiraceae bacterium]|jgi:lysophospholipase L1-like esterase|nr:GDSL-type esterase/lipase family protein [Oscillospiraceae bacterium]
MNIHGKFNDYLFGLHYARKCGRFRRENQYVRPGQLVLLGDSLMELWMVRGEGTYPRTRWEIYNRGISADTVMGCAGRLHESAIVLQPAVIVFLIGINDLLRKDFIPEELIATHRSIVQTLRNSLPDCRILVESLYPIHKGRTDPPQPTNALIRSVNEAYRATADEFGCDYLDVYPLLVDENDALRHELSPDGLHVNAKGYEIVREAIEVALGAH